MATYYYNQTLIIMRDYLGPAAERFLQRQARFHLRKDASEINRGDVAKLSEWIRKTFGVLSDDQVIVNQAAERIKKIGAKA